MATLFRRNDSFGYTMMEKESQEDKNHREAQFMIYKTMKQVDHITLRRSSKPCWLKLRISKLKVRIGKRLLKLKKTMLSNMDKTKMGVYKHVMLHLKNLKRLFRVDSGGRYGGSGGSSSGSSGGRHHPQPLFTT